MPHTEGLLLGRGLVKSKLASMSLAEVNEASSKLKESIFELIGKLMRTFEVDTFGPVDENILMVAHHLNSSVERIDASPDGFCIGFH